MSFLPVIVFDVNETLLDLQTMELTFEPIFSHKSHMRRWFSNLVLYSLALTLAGRYVPYTEIGAAVTKMMADSRGIEIDSKDKDELKEKFSTMPLYSEVPAALRKLRNSRFRVFILTNNLIEIQTQQLQHGGIAALFERCFSIDCVKQYKPSPRTYAYVAKELGVGPSQLCLVACHTWDTHGAVAAGWEAALIKRIGNDLLDIAPQPQIVGDDLTDVADQLVARHKAGR